MSTKYKLHTVNGREKLAPRVTPYWVRLAQGRFIGLHVGKSGHMYWRARLYVPAQQDYLYESFEECVPGVFDYDQAVKRCEAWFEEQTFQLYGRRLQRGPYTVGDACRDHVKRKLAAMDAGKEPHRRRQFEALFERIVLGTSPDPLTGKYRRGQGAHDPDPIANVAMTERELTASVINEWLLRRKARTAPDHPGRTVKVTTVNQEYKALRAALNGALDLKLAPRDLQAAWTCETNRPFKVNSSDKRRHGYLTRAQVDAWIAEITDETAASILRLQYLIGARPGKEIHQLTRGDFNDRRRELTIREGKTKFRIGALSVPAVELLKQLAKDKLPGAPLFLGPNGAPVNCYTYRDIYKAAALRAGLPKSTVPYCLRHSFITDALSTPEISQMDLATHCGTSVEQFRKHYFHLMTRGLADQLTAIQMRAAA